MNVPPIPRLTFRRHSADDLTRIEPGLVGIYAEVYSNRLDDPFFTVARFTDRLHLHAAQPGWQAVVADVDHEPVGYAYGAPRRTGTGYWETVTPVPSPAEAHETGSRTWVLYELMVRLPWRKTGVARAIHDELLRDRTEERVSLAVEQAHRSVRALYERWGYQYVGSRLPTPDAPTMDIMVRRLREP